MVTLRPSLERGIVDRGWLKAHHSFSFANYQDPKHVHFGPLLVINEDHFAPTRGFGMHPHEDMEIVTYVVAGGLKHEDSTGGGGTLYPGDVQRMSAGTGVQHSEFNPNEDKDLKLFQIWLFPNKRNVEPRYDQQKIAVDEHLNEFVQILSPDKDDAGVWIHQDAWFYLSDFDKDFSKKLALKKEGNGFYIFNIEGEIEVNGQKLEKRDAIGIWETNEIEIKANSDSRFLIMEIPMEQ